MEIYDIGRNMRYWYILMVVISLFHNLSYVLCNMDGPYIQIFLRPCMKLNVLNIDFYCRYHHVHIKSNWGEFWIFEAWYPGSTISHKDEWEARKCRSSSFISGIAWCKCESKLECSPDSMPYYICWLISFYQETMQCTFLWFHIVPCYWALSAKKWNQSPIKCHLPYF